MDQLRRYALALGSLALMLGACGEPRESASLAASAGGEMEALETVTVTNGESPGAFVVTNHGEEVSLSRHVLVEQSAAGEWRPTQTEVRLISTCEDHEVDSPRVVRQGESVVTAPWNGWSCGGQCPASCRANLYLGPGEFRFVVLSADETKRFEGPMFVLGPEPGSE